MKKIYICLTLIGMILVGVSTNKTRKSICELIKARKETKRKKKELEDLKKRFKEREERLKEEATIRQIKEQIELGKKNDSERAKVEKLARLTQRLCAEEPMTEEKMNEELKQIMDELGIKKPWVGDFNEFMSNPNNTLNFDL